MSKETPPPKNPAPKRSFTPFDGQWVGPVPTLAITPVADGRAKVFEENYALTWEIVRKVKTLIEEKVALPEGRPIRVVTAPEIVYGARTAALAQAYYATQGVSANIWVSRSWAYSDELMGACMGIGSSEWQQAAYGINQTDRPGAVWLKAFTAAMDEKCRPIFAIYSPDLEDESQPLSDFVAERILRFARGALAVAYIRGKNYLSIGGVAMGIVGSDARRNLMLHSLGMGTISYDMSGVRGRLDLGFYDHRELERALRFARERFRFAFGAGPRPMGNDELLRECLKMTLITRDLMIGNANLADPEIAAAQGFKADVEWAQGANAIAAGTQGQRQWTDLYPNFDLPEALLNSSFDWNGTRAPFIVATENDSKNAIGMLLGSLISGMPQLFADIRTNWTVKSLYRATGQDVGETAPHGLIDKRNSGAGALDFALDPYALAGADPADTSIQELAARFRASPELQRKRIAAALEATTFTGANLDYFRGDGLSSRFRTPGGIPMTAYRFNSIGDELTFSIVEGDTVELPESVADHIREVTDRTWPETFWAPREMSSFEYMSKIGPNHDGNSFGRIGADLITLSAMLRIPVDLHNVRDIFRPTLWDRMGGDDFRACSRLGPLYR